MISVRHILCIILLSLITSFVQAKTFVFTAIPDEDETRLKQRFDKVADYLSRELGVDVTYVPVKSYAAAVAAFRNNQVQLAWFGGLSGVQARRLVPGSIAIAQGEEDQYFKSYFIAHRSTGLKAAATLPKQLDPLTFTFGSKSSTSGRLMPEFYLRQHFQKSPDSLFKQVGFSGNHSRTLALVQSGAYQLGALNYKVWENELRAGKIDLEKVSIIWETPNYPDYQWTLRGDVDQHWGEDFQEKVTQALLGMDDPTLLSAFPRKRFVPASNDDYQAIIDTARSIGILD
jgi:phosphonate transport system substrate-binding protein